MSQKKQHYHGIFTVRHQVLPLDQQNSRPVPWLQGAEGDSAIANLNSVLASSMG